MAWRAQQVVAPPGGGPPAEKGLPKRSHPPCSGLTGCWPPRDFVKQCGCELGSQFSLDICIRRFFGAHRSSRHVQGPLSPAWPQWVCHLPTGTEPPHMRSGPCRSSPATPMSVCRLSCILFPACELTQSRLTRAWGSPASQPHTQPQTSLDPAAPGFEAKEPGRSQG